MEPPTLPPIISPSRRHESWLFKASCIVLLFALLHVPIMMTRGVIAERLQYQNQATAEIAGIWGRSQRVTGPILAVPYKYRTHVLRSTMLNGREVETEEADLAGAMAYFLPETLLVTGTVAPELRRRGIYETVVYAADLKLAGYFQPDFGAAGIEFESVDWSKARVLFGVSDLHGIRTVSPLQFAGGSAGAFESAGGEDGRFLPLAAKVAVVAGAKMEFSMAAALQGSERLEIVPTGRSTTATLQSPWADPSFTGASLPVSREVTKAGFNAKWETSHFSRGFSQSWSSRLVQNEEVTRKMDAVSFGVRFAQPVDGYSMTDRAQKYGTLFFALIFAVFALFEITAGLRIHPLQYALVGAGLCLFFLGFLALSELWTTGWAYTVAAAACTLLISLYTWSFLGTGWRTLVIGGALSATYGYLYFVLKSQDYALVAGTAALFGAVALVMFCTRRINWYELGAMKVSPGDASRGAW